MGAQPASILGPVLLQACIDYVNMLRKVYGDDLVLAPHVMSVDALKAQGTAGESAQLQKSELSCLAVLAALPHHHSILSQQTY